MPASHYKYKVDKPFQVEAQVALMNKDRELIHKCKTCTR